MTYCHVSAQIAQFADDCDSEICPECDSELVVSQLGTMWSKHCEDCGHHEDNEQDYEGNI